MGKEHVAEGLLHDHRSAAGEILVRLARETWEVSEKGVSTNQEMSTFVERDSDMD